MTGWGMGKGGGQSAGQGVGKGDRSRSPGGKGDRSRSPGGKGDRSRSPGGLSLAVEIGVIFVVLGLLPMAMIGWRYVDAAERQISEEIVQNLAVIADGRAQEVESFARARLREARMVASAPLLAQAVGVLQGAGWGMEHGPVMLPPNAGSPEENFRTYLTRVRATMDAPGLYLIALDGSVVFSDGDPLGWKGREALKSVFDRAATLLEPQLSDFVENGRGGVVAFSAAPMLRDGAVQGVVALSVGLEDIASVLRDYTGLGATGETQLGGSDPGGVRLYGGSRFPAEAPLTGVITSDDPAAWPFQRALAGHRGHGAAVDYRGHRVLAAWRYLPSYGWAMVVKADLEERMARVDRLRNMGLVVLVTLIVLVLAVALFLARAISAPILELEVAASLLSSGKMRELKAEAGPREVKALARTFNDMAHRVHAYQTGLKRMVEERTAELRIAKEQAENAVQAKTDFLAMMSHEIRTPLNGLLGVAELLDARELDDQSRGQVRTIRQSGAALAELLNDILDISRVEAGKVDFLRMDFDLEGLITGIIELMRSTAERKGITLDLRFGDQVPATLLGDPARLRQVVLNLVGNAIKFTETGGVTVLVTPRGQDHAQALIRLTVEDTGIGVPERHREALFQPFNQISADRSTRYGGAGLGLAISRRLVEGMGGVIFHEANPGGGSRFHVDLTFDFGSAEGMVASPRVALPSPLPSLSILLVEDEPVNRQVLEGFLAADGHVVQSATTGAEALELVETERFDMVLTDLRLPGLSGLDVTRRVRERGGPPVIAVTANVLPEDRAACYAAGVVDIVAKPILSADLRKAVLAAWENRDAAPVPSPPPSSPRVPSGSPEATPDPAGKDLAEEPPLFTPAYLEDMAAALPPEEVARLVDLAGASIRSALGRLDDEPSTDAAHRLAGVAGTYGLMRLRARAKALETALLRGADADTGETEGLVDLTRDSLAALKVWKDGLG
ncbi:MAG: response regulator [Rhodospirillum sp.]|nr:response regulator [Rhodospirillum sp.]